MANTLLRLLWALPLVLLTGFAIMLLLRRFLAPPSLAANASKRMAVQESLALSEQTRAHLLEVDGHPYVLVESSCHAALHAIPLAGARPRLGAAAVPAWMRRIYKQDSR